jgi:hypothetical protein
LILRLEKSNKSSQDKNDGRGEDAGSTTDISRNTKILTRSTVLIAVSGLENISGESIISVGDDPTLRSKDNAVLVISNDVVSGVAVLLAVQRSDVATDTMSECVKELLLLRARRGSRKRRRRNRGSRGSRRGGSRRGGRGRGSRRRSRRNRGRGRRRSRSRSNRRRGRRSRSRSVGALDINGLTIILEGPVQPVELEVHIKPVFALVSPVLLTLTLRREEEVSTLTLVVLNIATDELMIARSVVDHVKIASVVVLKHNPVLILIIIFMISTGLNLRSEGTSEGASGQSGEDNSLEHF